MTYISVICVNGLRCLRDTVSEIIFKILLPQGTVLLCHPIKVQ